MLKISVQRDETKSTLLLAGKLAGPWVAEVRSSWDAERATAKEVWVDLNEVTFIDAEGKALLTKLHQEGATLNCKGCLTRAIIAQVCGESSEAGTHQNKMNSSHKIIKAILIGFFAFAIQNFSSAQAQEKPAIQLTLHDAVALALKQNPQVQIGVLQAAEAKQDQNIARADLLPQAQLNVSDSVNRANLETAFGRPFPGFPRTPRPISNFQCGAFGERSDFGFCGVEPVARRPRKYFGGACGRAIDSRGHGSANSVAISGRFARCGASEGRANAN